MKEIRINDKGRTCTGECGHFKSWTEFYDQKSGRNGKNSVCKVCVIEKAKANYQKRKKAADRDS